MDCFEIVTTLSNLLPMNKSTVIRQSLICMMIQMAFMPLIADEHKNSGHKERIARKWQDKLKDSYSPLNETRSGPVRFLGVYTMRISPTLSAQLSLPTGMGLTIRHIVPNSPAAEAGLKEHDILRKFEDQILIHPQQLQVLIRARNEGESVSFTILREGKEIKVEAKLKTRKPGRYKRGHNSRFWIDKSDGYHKGRKNCFPPISGTSANMPHLHKRAHIFKKEHTDADKRGHAIPMPQNSSSSESLKPERNLGPSKLQR